MTARFYNRIEAGQALARRLRHYAFHPEVVVLALPRGGAPVGYEIAMKLRVPLEVFIVRKLGVPGHEEFAMGAIASGGISYLNDKVIQPLRISKAEIARVIAREKEEMARRETEYGMDHHRGDYSRQTIILVDDGLATGATMRAAILALHQQRPQKIIAAVPVAPQETAETIKELVDEFICVLQPETFFAVGEWYTDFSATTDEEVRMILENAQANLAGHVASAPPVL